MKLYLLILSCLMAITAHSQSKEASFRKLDSLLQNANGYTNSKFKLVKQSASEKQLKMELIEEGKKTVVEFGKINWKDFDISVEPEEENKTYAKLKLTLIDDAKAKYYVAGKLEDDEESDEVFVFIKKEDEKAVRKELSEIAFLFWPEVNALRKLDKQGLINYINPKLKAAITDSDANLISLNECEMRIKSGSKEYTLPTKVYEIHEDTEDEGYYTICYGKAKTTALVKSGSSSERETLEHPEIALEFKNGREESFPLQVALKLLAIYCKK